MVFPPPTRRRYLFGERRSLTFGHVSNVCDSAQKSPIQLFPSIIPPWTSLQTPRNKGKSSAEETHVRPMEYPHEWPELILDRLADAGVARITLNRPEKRNS
jgi:hypothetical protein